MILNFTKINKDKLGQVILSLTAEIAVLGYNLLLWQNDIVSATTISLLPSEKSKTHVNMDITQLKHFMILAITFSKNSRFGHFYQDFGHKPRKILAILLVNAMLCFGMKSSWQRWIRIRITGVLRFSFGPGSWPGVKNLGKTGSGSGVTFLFGP